MIGVDLPTTITNNPARAEQTAGPTPASGESEHEGPRMLRAGNYPHGKPERGLEIIGEGSHHPDVRPVAPDELGQHHTPRAVLRSQLEGQGRADLRTLLPTSYQAIP